MSYNVRYIRFNPPFLERLELRYRNVLEPGQAVHWLLLIVIECKMKYRSTRVSRVFILSSNPLVTPAVTFVLKRRFNGFIEI